MDYSLYLLSGALLLIAFVVTAWRLRRRSGPATDPSPRSLVAAGELATARPGEPPIETRLRRTAREGGDEAAGVDVPVPAQPETNSSERPAPSVRDEAVEVSAATTPTPPRERPAEEGRDAATGLPNRATFLEELKRRVAQLRREPAPHVLAMVRIDGFGEILSERGLRASEHVLARTAERLLAALREGDTVARFDRDTFVLSLGDLSAADAAAVVERFRKCGCQELELEGDRRIAVTASSSFVPVDPSTEAAHLVACCRGALAMAKCGESLAVS